MVYINHALLVKKKNPSKALESKKENRWWIGSQAFLLLLLLPVKYDHDQGLHVAYSFQVSKARQGVVSSPRALAVLSQSPAFSVSIFGKSLVLVFVKLLVLISSLSAIGQHGAQMHRHEFGYSRTFTTVGNSPALIVMMGCRRIAMAMEL